MRRAGRTPRDPPVPPEHRPFRGEAPRPVQAPRRRPGTPHLHRETSQAYLDQVTAEHYVYRKPKKGRGKGKWSWEPKAEGRANHYGDTLVGVFAIADMKNCRTLPAREVLAARRSALAGQAKAPAAAGVRMPDGRSFLAVSRR